MKFIAVSALLAAAVSAASIDFHSPEAAACATRHWGEIVDIINPKIPLMNQFLSGEKLEQVKGMLGGKKELSKDEVPPADFISKAADALPPVLLEKFGGDIIAKCVAEQK
ncbi:hypothetical protein FBU59_002275 [Linderina macrospora]|uniref:Uncharacterized protein n=1 Tax=Linderina macrospora TaxID=4868 RepID=A0ACC1JBL0_9FUNG|nr:hypothetical protein FBU59_002275 [Linderina macrospora]